MPLFPSPPRRWIRPTLGSLVPVRVGPFVRAAVRSLTAAAQEQGDPLVCEFNDRELAEVIIDDAPHYRCGDNSINGRGHGAWALTIMGRDEEAWLLYLPMIRIAPKLRSGEVRIEIPVGQLLILMWLALKRGTLQEAYLAQRLISQRAGSLNHTLQEDFKGLTQALLAHEKRARPVLVAVGDC